MLARYFRARPVAASALAACSTIVIILSAWAVVDDHEPGEVGAMRDAAVGKNLVMVLLDVAAFEHFGYAGYDRDTTPVIDALTRESVIFRTAYSPAASTAHTVYTMLTSSYPFLTEKGRLEGVHDAAFRVTETTLLMAEQLAPRFTHRSGISANEWFGPEFGFDRGFTHFYQSHDTEEFAEWTNRHAERVVKLFERDLAEWGEGPAFSYVHFLEPHTPYLPPDPFARMFDPVAIDSVDARSRSLIRRSGTTWWLRSGFQQRRKSCGN